MRIAPQRPGLKHCVVFLAISALTTVIIGSTVYYAFKRQDNVHARAAEYMALEAHTQRVRSISHVIGALSHHVIQDGDGLQAFLDAGLDSEGLRDLKMISQDGVVQAAKDTSQVGQRFDYSVWAGWKSREGVVPQPVLDRAGRQELTILEPIKYHDASLGWAMLVFTLPEQRASLATIMDHLEQTAQVMTPVLPLLLMSSAWAMRRGMAGIRQKIKAVLASVPEEPTEIPEKELTRARRSVNDPMLDVSIVYMADKSIER